MDYIYLAIGIIVGGIIGWLLMRSKLSNQKNNFQKDMSSLEQSKQDEINTLDKEKVVLNEKYNTIQSTNEKLTDDLQNERKRGEELNTRIAKAEVEFKNLKEKLDTQKSELEDLQKKFTTEFENIANKILKQNSQEFTQVNQKNIGEILNPLKEKIQTFEKKVEDTYEKGIKDQTNLKAEIKKLYDLNFKISEEANNLTRAL